MRGGRFVDGLEGEQFAAPEAVDKLRKTTISEESEWIILSSADPLNLSGVLSETRIPSSRTNQLVIRGGQIIAHRVAGTDWFADHLSQKVRNHLHHAMKLPGSLRKGESTSRESESKEHAVDYTQPPLKLVKSED